MEKLMTYKEVANQLGVTDRYIAKLVSLDEIPFIKIGKAVRFNPVKIMEWLEKKSSDNLRSAPFPAMVTMRKNLTIVKVEEGIV